MAEMQSRELQIAPASIGRVALSGFVVFLLHYAIAVFLGIVLAIPTMIFLLQPLVKAIDHADPNAVFPNERIIAIFPLLFVGGFAIQILATILALAFVIGKHWGGARLAFVYD